MFLRVVKDRDGPTGSAFRPDGEPVTVGERIARGERQGAGWQIRTWELSYARGLVVSDTVVIAGSVASCGGSRTR